MKARYYNSISLALLLLLLGSSVAMAQEKEVVVIKPYSPTLSTASKIQLLPSMQEEVELDVPAIDYELYPKRYPSVFQVDPIRAARMVPMPLERLYRTELTMGVGNYFTPLVDLRINQLRSRNGTFGFYLRHHSMNGKVKLDNDRKAPAGYNKNKLGVHGSRFKGKTGIDYQAGVAYDSYVHYGVNPSEDTVLERSDATHGYFLAQGGVEFYSMHTEDYKFNYRATVNYHFFSHAFVENENLARTNFRFTKKLNLLDLGGDAGLLYLNQNPWNTTDPSRWVFHANPYVSKGNDQWRFLAGINFFGDITDAGFKPIFHPRASFMFHMVKEVLVPYFEVNGKYVTHPIRNVIDENPYLTPGSTIRPTNHKLIAKVGLKGRLTDAMAYNLLASYSIVDDDYFWVNDNSNPLGNQFVAVYDDVTIGRLHGELTFRPSGSWKLFFKGNYYSYMTMVSLEQPWNKPKWDLGAEARYNMADKIIVKASLITVGARYYEDYDLTTDSRLPMMLDANLGVEYRYSSLLSFWARANNLAAQQYYMYNQYPSYRFRLMLGFTYAL